MAAIGESSHSDLALETSPIIRLVNVRFTPETSRSDDTMLKGHL